VDVELSNLVPYVSQTVDSPTGQGLDVGAFLNSENLFRWEIGPESMQVAWADPTLMQVKEGRTTTIESDDCVYELPDPDVWVYWVIETALAVPHPIHLHGKYLICVSTLASFEGYKADVAHPGHDFFILASAASATYDSSVTLNLNNPPRRDVANLPAAGYLVIAFKTDNPGTW
jgi:hypothetical protein